MANKKLVWNVYRHDVNKNKIEVFNIFQHGRFMEDVNKNFKKNKNKEDFIEQLRRDLMYYYWSKCEHEVIITSFPTYVTTGEIDRLNTERDTCRNKYNREPVKIGVELDTEIKIDIYNQVMNNFEIFAEYVWNSRIHRARKKNTTE